MLFDNLEDVALAMKVSEDLVVVHSVQILDIPQLPAGFIEENDRFLLHDQGYQSHGECNTLVPTPIRVLKGWAQDLRAALVANTTVEVPAP